MCNSDETSVYISPTSSPILPIYPPAPALALPISHRLIPLHPPSNNLINPPNPLTTSLDFKPFLVSLSTRLALFDYALGGKLEVD